MLLQDDDDNYVDEAYEVLDKRRTSIADEENDTSSEILDIQTRLMKAVADMGFDTHRPDAATKYSYDEIFSGFMAVIDNTEWEPGEEKAIKQIRTKLISNKKKALDSMYMTVHNFCVEVIS